MRKNIKAFKKILVASVYHRHTSSDTISLVQVSNSEIADLDVSNYNAYLLGDFHLNISMNRRSASVAQNYLDMLANNSMSPIITQPTRVTSTLQLS